MKSRCRFARVSSLAAFCAALALGSCRTDRDVQRDYARRLAPAQLDTVAPPAEAIREVRVQVYADADYRREMIRWRAHIEALLARANRLLEPRFHVRLIATSFEAWERAAKGRTLDNALGELAEASRGARGDWVLGWVSSAARVAGPWEQLGIGQVFGRHVVLRSAVSFEEREAMRRTLDKLSDAERDALLDEREIHRETAVLLHEWAHTLGAFHERDADTLMSPHYGKGESGFSESAARIIELGLARRGADGPGARADWARAYRAEVERARATAWDEATVEEALRAAQGLEARREEPPAARTVPSLARVIGAGTAARGESTALDPARPTPATEAAALLQSETNNRLGDPARAWRLVASLAAQHPERRHLTRWACYLSRRARAPTPRTPDCAREKVLGAAGATLALARALEEAGDHRASVAALLRARTAFETVAPTPADWGELSALLAHAGACTLAERTAPRAARAPSAASPCAQTRARAALPLEDSGVEPEREPEYIEAVLIGRSQAEAGRLAPARAAAAGLEAEFPRAPGAPFLRCLIEAQGGDARAARAACVAADRGPPFAFEPPYVLGMLAGWEGRWGEARDELRRALQRNDRDRVLWARLAYALGKLDDRAGRAALAERFRARFGATLRAEW